MKSTPRNSHRMDCQSQPIESPEEKAQRLIEPLRGLLKEEFAQFGGAEGFLRWVRGYDEEEQDKPSLPDASARR